MLKVGKFGTVGGWEGELLGALVIAGLGLEGEPPVRDGGELSIVLGVLRVEACKGKNPGGSLGEVLVWSNFNWVEDDKLGLMLVQVIILSNIFGLCCKASRLTTFLLKAALKSSIFTAAEASIAFILFSSSRFLAIS